MSYVKEIGQIVIARKSQSGRGDLTRSVMARSLPTAGRSDEAISQKRFLLDCFGPPKAGLAMTAGDCFPPKADPPLVGAQARNDGVSLLLRSSINQAVRRNIDRFPADFMFALNRGEIRNLSQVVISLKHAPGVFAFTEQGVAMLSSILHSKRAAQVNIQIMRTFIKLREMIASNEMVRRRIEKLERKFAKHDEQIQQIFEAIKELLEPPPAPPKRPIGFHV